MHFSPLDFQRQKLHLCYNSYAFCMSDDNGDKNDDVNVKVHLSGMHAPPRPRGKWLPRGAPAPKIFKNAPPRLVSFTDPLAFESGSVLRRP